MDGKNGEDKQQRLRIEEFFSNKAGKLKSSDVRNALSLAEGKDIISFAGGLPDPRTFPHSEIKEIISSLEKSELSAAFQYGATSGMKELRKELARFVSSRGIHGITEKNVLVSTGSQEAIYILCSILLNPGDDIIVESPTYLAALSAMRLAEPIFHGVPLEDDGMDLVILEKELKGLKDNGRRAKFIYTIPVTQNPGGITMSQKKREKLLELARKYDTLIIEDDAYGFLPLEMETPKAIKSMDREGRVIYLSTFSKILAPGFRLGWAVADERIISKMALMQQNTTLHPSTFTQKVALEALKRRVIEKNLPTIKKTYKEKREVMLTSIKRWFPKDIRYTTPLGGMFVFVELDPSVDTRGLLEKAVERGVAFVPGSGFYHDGSGRNSMRLNFTQPSVRDIKKGIRILGELIKKGKTTNVNGN